jgi:hypothetical protein
MTTPLVVDLEAGARRQRHGGSYGAVEQRYQFAGAYGSERLAEGSLDAVSDGLRDLRGRHG